MCAVCKLNDKEKLMKWFYNMLIMSDHL